MSRCPHGFCSGLCVVPLCWAYDGLGAITETPRRVPKTFRTSRDIVRCQSCGCVCRVEQPHPCRRARRYERRKVA